MYVYRHINILQACKHHHADDSEATEMRHHGERNRGARRGESGIREMSRRNVVRRESEPSPTWNRKRPSANAYFIVSDARR